MHHGYDKIILKEYREHRRRIWQSQKVKEFLDKNGVRIFPRDRQQLMHCFMQDLLVFG